MFSPLLKLETVCKAQRMQHKVGCSNDIKPRTCNASSGLSITQVQFSAFQTHSCCMALFAQKEANSVLSYQGQRCFCQEPNHYWHVGYQIRMQPQHCALSYPSVLSARTGCTGAAVPPAQPFLSSLFRTQSDGYINPLLCYSKMLVLLKPTPT